MKNDKACNCERKIEPVRYNHIWLYARKRYPATHDVTADLRLIFAHHFNMVDVPSHITDEFIIMSMFELVEQYVTSTIPKIKLLTSLLGPLIGLASFNIPPSADVEMAEDRMLFVLRTILQVLKTTSEVEAFYLGNPDLEIEKLLKADR